MELQRTYTQKTTYGGRLGNSIKGVFAGIIFIIIAIGILWVNEGRSIRQTKAINAAEEQMVEVDSGTIDPLYDGKVIATKGTTHTQFGLVDPIFYVQSNGLAIKRTAEMYQWVESRKENSNDNTVSYTYHESWEEEPVNSDGFEYSGYDNPGMVYQSETGVAPDVQLGSFKLSDAQVRAIDHFTPVRELTPFLNQFPEPLRGGSVIGNVYYTGDPQKPIIGDYRFTFAEIPNDLMVSALAVQSGNELRSYEGPRGGSVEVIKYGSYTPNELIGVARKDNLTLTWLLRLFGVLMLILGISALLKPIASLFSFIPVVGRIAGNITGGISFLVGVIVGGMVIALSWVAHRTVPTILVLAIGLGIIWLVLNKKKQPKIETSIDQEN